MALSDPPKKVTSSFSTELGEFQGGVINLRMIGEGNISLEAD